MKLNYRLTTSPSNTSAVPILLLHGLFGNLDNLGGLARDLQATHSIVQVDLRNHGISPRSDSMNYTLMAEGIIELMDELDIPSAIVIGHSMGGKVAMTLTALAPERIHSVVVIDIAPIAYQVRNHDLIFAALEAVTAAGISQRQVAANTMREYLTEEGVIQFLLKSFVQGEWRFNLPALKANYSAIIGWETVPAWSGSILFISGGDSSYITPAYRQDILTQFPLAKAHIIAGCGHWVHAEKPATVLRAIRRFLSL